MPERRERPDPEPGTERVGLGRRVWRSLVRGPLQPRDDRERMWVVVNNFILHLRPVRLPARSLRYTHTFGLGGMSAVLFVLLAMTGILLMFVYEPTPERAYGSILTLQNEVFFGKLVRNVHHWSANFLIVIVVLHLLRAYFSGGYHGPRQFNWVIGLALLACVIAANFTGYLLPWDQLSYWAITISTSMIRYVPLAGGWLERAVRGGPEIGSATLINFYTLHTTVIPVALVLLMGWHFWRVRKAKGVVVPRGPDETLEDQPEVVLALPHLMLRELSVALILVAVVLWFAVLVDPALGDAANPGMSPNPAKAPWYFMGIQELLLHFHPLFAVVIIPTAATLALLAIPYVRYDGDTAGIWFMSRRGRRLAVIAALVALLVTPAWIVADELWIGSDGWLPGLPPVIGVGLVPVTIMLAALLGFAWLLKKRYGATRDELIQTAFVLLATAFVVLTVTGVWFRGPGMALVWPWDL
ncbi:MAG TPA: cytochrome b N-terminal domain-containing protein [Gemmatimonadota bacterium]|nr:cytochrome b N-terminal domain-containing protein [Gemmatimonadota bacterium]